MDGLVVDLLDALREFPSSCSTPISVQCRTRVRSTCVFPRIHYNRFFQNGVGSTSGVNRIWLFDGYPGGVTFPVLDATSNFWGTSVSNPAAIAGLIRDMTDAPAVETVVDFDPWLNVDPREPPAKCP
jgi:hypothetical protein